MNKPEINPMSHAAPDTAAGAEFDVEHSRARELVFSSEHERADTTAAAPTQSATVNPFEPQP